MKQHLRFWGAKYYFCGLRVPEKDVNCENDTELCRQCNDLSSYLLMPYGRNSEKVVSKLLKTAKRT
jgi:hypothetical protein